MYSIKYQSIHNFIDKDHESENEDSVHVKESDYYYRFALADGAGGAGIFCKNWAEHLTSNQPEEPISNSEIAKKWFLDLSHVFHDNQLNKIKTDDPTVIEKFYQEGSYSTVLYCWISKKDNKLYYTAIGDSTLFVLGWKNNKYETKLITSLTDQSRLDESPSLLNWRKELKYDLVSNAIELVERDIIIMGSDSLSRWLLLNLLLLDKENVQKLLPEILLKNINNEYREFLEQLNMYGECKSTAELIKFVYNLLKDSSIYIISLQKLIQKNELEQDDFSLIYYEYIK